MARKGLEGLKGLDFSTAEGQAWVDKQKRAGVVTSSWRPSDIKQLYRNQQFIDKYGIDAFNSMINDPVGRSRVYEEDIINKAFYDAFNPFFEDDESKKGLNGELYDASKGMGRDFFKYNLMSTEAKRELLESDWLTKSEIDDKISKEQHDIHQMHMDPGFAGTERGADAIFSYNMLGKDLEETIDRGQNDKLIEGIYSRDLKKKTSELAPVVDQYYTENISQMSDDEVKANFMKTIKPNEGEGAAYIYSAYFNDDGTSSERETDKFSIDDMRQFLARKAVYDYYLGPEAGYDALNNQGKEYINDHQAWYTYAGLLAKDIIISTASYTADKWNSIRRLTLLGQDANVYMTNDGKVVPTADVINEDGQSFYEVDGEKVPVHAQTLSKIALDDMGYDSDGNERGWFNNAQFWTNAEQFGTMDEKELAQYKKLGYSPYKVVYKPGDESDIWYEAIKMTSFGLADMASNFIPVGGMTVGANTIAKAAEMTGAMSKAMQIGGKALYYTGKVGYKANPIISATAIGNAYGRGVFGETFAGNLQQVEQSVADQAQKEVYNLYTTNDEYKASVDAEVEQRYRELAAAQQAQIMASEGQMRILDPKANEDVLRSRALREVLNSRTNQWAEEYKNSDMYGRALQEAAESASDAALTSSLTTAAKYTAVNYGWRRYLFKTPSEMSASYRRGAIEGVTEITNAAGKKRLASKFDFLTIGGQARELAKTVGSQMWGGAWTNATDELQSGGGRRISEDRMSQFISGMYNGKALDARYSVIDRVSSYFHGAVSALANENTYRAGLIGGLGSMTSFTPNLTSLVTTKNFKETWRNSSFGERMNMILTNGVLNKYYAKKQGQLQLKFTVDLVNKMLDETNDFEAIDQAIALDMASIDATNPEDANALSFLKAVQSIDMLNRFREDKEAAQVGEESTVMQKAMTTIEKLSDPSKLTNEEKADFLTQYYAENPGTAQSESQNEIALQELQQRAQRLQEASETYAEVENTLAKVEKDRGTRIPNQVRARLMQRLTLDKFLTDRTAELEKKITGNSTPSSSESIIESYGTVGHQKSQVRATESLIKSMDKEITKAEDKLSEAKRAMDDYNSTPQNDQGFVKKTQLQKAINSARIQVEHLNNIRRSLNLELDRFREQALPTVDAVANGAPFEYHATAKTSDRVIAADEILRLNPQDRARMLADENFNNYSEEQKEEIVKCRTQLYFTDPSLLNDVQNQANLTQKIEANRRAYAMMLENPEAAAYQLESDMSKQALEARAVHFDRQAAMIGDALYKMFKEGKYKGDSVGGVRDRIYRNLRVLNRDLLDYMHDNANDFGYMFKEIQDAIDWSDMTTDMSHIIDSMEMEDAPKKAFTDSLDAMLEKTKSRAEVLDELGKVIESSGVEASAKVPYENLLNELEQLWNQRASTTSMTREERKAAQEEHNRKLAEEEQRKKDAEKAAREEAERRAVEAAATGITEADVDTSNDRVAELEAQGLTEKDIATDNEGTLTPEHIAQAVEEGVDVDLESPTLDEQAAAAPDKVDIIPAPVDDSTDQGNVLPETSDTLLGNSMYGYELGPLKFHGKQVPRKGANPNDKMSRYFAWMESAGIKLQDIIDTELSDIMKLNPDVFPMFVKFDKNATNDDAMVNFVLLTVEYTQDVANIHNDKNGGVITSDGKQYLVVGTLGFASGNRAQSDMVRSILKSGQKSWFDAHPSERFFVDTRKHTQIQSIASGRLVRQLATDAEIQIRSISELLADESRNPKGLTMGDLKWGIQYGNRLATVNVSERNTVYPPSDSASNLGSVFLLVEAANGNYIPDYIRPVRYSEINNGRLKSRIDDIFNRLTSTDLAERIKAWKELRQVVVCKKEGNWVLYGDETHNTVTVQVNGVNRPTHDLESPNFDRNKLLRELEEADFRINITISALSTETSLEELNEAGALTTDLAKLGTSGASYNVYAMDANGNPIITAPVESEAPTLDAGSDLTKAQKKMSSERMGNATYRKDTTGNWYTETDKLVTDPRLIEQLNYRNLIRTRYLIPDKTMGMDEVFIVNNDKDNPLVLVRRKGSQIFAMSKEGAVKTINEVNAELAEKARQERLQKELEIEVSNDEAILNMSEEDRRKAADEGEDVDLGLGDTLTDEQIVKQMTGNFEVEATPQQKTAEELVEKITADTADIQLAEDVAPTREESDKSAKQKAKAKERLARVEAALESSDVKLWSDSPSDNVTITSTSNGFNSPYKSSRLFRTAKDYRTVLNAKIGDVINGGAKVVYKDRYGNTYIEIQNAEDGNVKSAIVFPISGRGGDNFTVYFYKTLNQDEKDTLISAIKDNPNRKGLIEYVNTLLSHTNDNLLYLSYRNPDKLARLRAEAYTKPEAPIVQSEPVKTGEDINKTGTKSLAELQSEKTTDTAILILKSKKFGQRARVLLKAKFPDMPSKMSELERFLQSKGIATTGISDVEQWLKMIEECK